MAAKGFNNEVPPLLALPLKLAKVSEMLLCLLSLAVSFGDETGETLGITNGSLASEVNDKNVDDIAVFFLEL